MTAVPLFRRPGAARASFGVQHLVVLGVLAQSVLAGLLLFVDPAAIRVHNVVGTALIPIALVVVLLVLAAGFQRRGALTALAWLQFGLLAVQHTLGLLGRESAVAAALHLPNAFVVFTVAMLWLVRARRELRGES